jgi:hypothetical protein
MKYNTPETLVGPTWHCVLDRQMRLVYLGMDEVEAQAASLPGSTLRSAPKMGNALRLAAIAVGVERTRRSG